MYQVPQSEGWTESTGRHCSITQHGKRLHLKVESDMQNEDGWTPLHEACCLGNAEIAEALLKHGADTQARCKDGTTPMHKAARAGNAAVIALLLQAGADDSAVDKVGFACRSMVLVKGQLNHLRAMLTQLNQSPKDLFCPTMPDVNQDIFHDDHGSHASHLQHGLEPVDCAVDEAIAKLLSEGSGGFHSAAPFNAPSADSAPSASPTTPRTPRMPRTPKQARPIKSCIGQATMSVLNVVVHIPP